MTEDFYAAQKGSRAESIVTVSYKVNRGLRIQVRIHSEARLLVLSLLLRSFVHWFARSLAHPLRQLSFEFLSVHVGTFDVEVYDFSIDASTYQLW